MREANAETLYLLLDIIGHIFVERLLYRVCFSHLNASRYDTHCYFSNCCFYNGRAAHFYRKFACLGTARFYRTINLDPV
jgi:hypothetical protein